MPATSWDLLFIATSQCSDTKGGELGSHNLCVPKEGSEVTGDLFLTPRGGRGWTVQDCLAKNPPSCLWTVGLIICPGGELLRPLTF